MEDIYEPVMSKRAVRRHHYNRLKKKRSKYGYTANEYYQFIDVKDEAVLGMLVSHPKSCSSPWCCGNPRRRGKKTKQEHVADESLECYLV